jgi:rhamnogalacturonan endolyase
MKLYRGEFLVKSQNVTATTGTTTICDIKSEDPIRQVLFRVGEFDGQPFEFKNGDKFLRMYYL